MTLQAVVLILSCVALVVTGDYELQVTILSFSNSEGQCADRRCVNNDVCCDGTACPNSCDYYFSVCQRETGDEVSMDNRAAIGQLCQQSQIRNTTVQSATGGHTYGGTSNLTPLTGAIWPVDGVQLYMELLDDDLNSGYNRLIDRFAIQVSSDIGGEEILVKPGVFGLAEINLLVRVVCTGNFYGPNCNISCTGDCTCPPGFTGEFCATNIDDCVGVDCGENQRCVDGVNTHTCECVAGYVGINCQIDIDECVGVNCNGGTCVQGTASFTCECPPEYTGQFCEMEVDSYKVQVTINSFNNPEGRCADERCMEDLSCCTAQEVCPTSCDYFFFLCLRPAHTPVSMTREAIQGECGTSAVTTGIGEVANGANFAGEIFGTPNPIILTGIFWPNEGMQLYLELLDQDHILNTNVELIDRFSISVSTGIGETETKTISGIFGLAVVNLTVGIVCTENYTGLNCDTFCTEDCTCAPGFTGEFCATNIDDCVGVDCGENQRCVDGVNTHTCECEAGYTGADCLTDIDECVGVNCNGGTCMQGTASFTCECPPEYTGQFCETEVDSYWLQVTFHSFINPEGRCADQRCLNDGYCCSAKNCPSRCHYYFSLCLRPADTPVSEVPEENQGNCVELITGTMYRSRNEQFFDSNIFGSGTPNPINFYGSVWPASGMQLYIELLDRDLRDGFDDDLIDRFGIEISTNTTGMQTYAGMFGYASLSLSTSLQCTPHFTGELCETLIEMPEVTESTTLSDSTSADSFEVETTMFTETVMFTEKENAAEDGLLRTIPAIVVPVVTLIALLTVFLLCIVLGRRYRRSKRYAVQSQVISYSAGGTSGDQEVVNLNDESDVDRGNFVASLSDPHSLRQRLESNPNDYSKLLHSKNKTPTLCSASNPQFSDYDVHCTPEDNYECPCDGKKLETKVPENDYDTASLPSNGADKAMSEEVYDYTKSEGVFDDYDYESLYEKPSDEKMKLLKQFRKLRVSSIMQGELEEKEVLGSGAFGTVYKGVWRHSQPGSDQLVEEEVAVKTMEAGASEEDRIKFLQEAAIMGQFDHPNIVKIMGVMVNPEECKIIMELMTIGNFRSHLPTLRTSLSSQSELASQLLFYSRQVASGMNYLALKGYVHRDLAARNVLVSKDDVCKIADFGLSRDLQDENYYMAHGGKIPVKWTAPEALSYRLYSHASDVWSYGCVLYEIWTLGLKPYSHLSNSKVISTIASGYRLPPPPGCPKAIYDIMIKCWNEDSKLRPKFNDVSALVHLPEFKVLKWSEEDLARYGEEARTIGAPLAEGETLFTELQNTYKSE